MLLKEHESEQNTQMLAINHKKVTLIFAGNACAFYFYGCGQ